jgi:hypothetical protein
LKKESHPAASLGVDLTQRLLEGERAIPKVNFTIKKYNILKSTSSMKLYIVFLIDLELLFRQTLTDALAV